MPAIDERLNFVIPLYDDGQETPRAYVFATPISRAVFEAHFALLAKTFAMIQGDGYGAVAGPRVASLLLREVATREYGPEAAEKSVPLVKEIRRLTNVLVREGGKWAILPYETSRTDPAVLDEDEVAEVDNALVFFIALSAMVKRAHLRANLDWPARIWGAQVSSLSATAFLASLPISTPAANTSTAAAPAPAPSLPPDQPPAAAQAPVSRPKAIVTMEAPGDRPRLSSLPV